MNWLSRRSYYTPKLRGRSGLYKTKDEIPFYYGLFGRGYPPPVGSTDPDSIRLLVKSAHAILSEGWD